MKNIILLLLIAMATFSQINAKNKITFYDLKTEYKTTPINIDTKTPGLSWKIKATERNTLQDHYQIQVALNAIDLKQGRNVLWD